MQHVKLQRIPDPLIKVIKNDLNVHIKSTNGHSELHITSLTTHPMMNIVSDAMMR